VLGNLYPGVDVAVLAVKKHGAPHGQADEHQHTSPEFHDIHPWLNVKHGIQDAREQRPITNRR
jgi:hypothetical protein